MRKRVRMGGMYSAHVQRDGRFYCFSMLLLTVFLSACAGPQPTTAITATSTAETAELIFPPTPTPRASTPTFTPTATLVPQPTLEPTLTPEPTETPTPEPTETPDPVTAEAQKVVEYVEAHGSPIHLAQIPGMRLEATEQLQQAIWNRIPKELQELGPNPLFLIIPDADRLRAVIDTLSIQVEGHENKVPLAGREVVFTFMSVNEEVPDVMLPLYYGQGNGSYRIGAYEASDDSIRIVVRTSNQVSTSYSYEKYPEWELVNDGFIYGLYVLSGSARQAPDFQNDFSYDAVEYDHLFPGNAQNKTKMTFPAAAEIDHDGQGRYLFTIGFVDGYRSQIPAEYQEVNR